MRCLDGLDRLRWVLVVSEARLTMVLLLLAQRVLTGARTEPVHACTRARAESANPHHQTLHQRLLLLLLLLLLVATGAPDW